MKRAKVVKPKSEAMPKDRTKDDMVRFHRSVDWAAWWEEFYSAINPNGTEKYRTVGQFARAKGENQSQKLFISYVCGSAEDVDEDIPESWKRFKPMNWYEKRETGGWFSESSLRQLSREITAQNTALDALRETGNKITVKSLVRTEAMAQQLDREFRGRFFADELAFERNVERAKLYLDLHRKILDLQARAQEMYAKSHGVNFAMDGFTQLLAGIRLGADGGNPEHQRTHKIMGKIIDMVLDKSQTHDIPLPEGMEEQILVLAKKEKVN